VADVFISYKSERRNAAQHLSRILELNGYSVWFDYGLLSGGNFGPQIEREIRAAKAVVVLWCSLSRESDWVQEEANLAKGLGSLTPVWLEHVALPLGFTLTETIDLSDWDGTPRSHKLDHLLGEIARRVGREPAPSFNGLKNYEQTWRSFGALTLAQFALTQPVSEKEKRRGLGTRKQEDATPGRKDKPPEIDVPPPASPPARESFIESIVEAWDNNGWPKKLMGLVLLAAGMGVLLLATELGRSSGILFGAVVALPGVGFLNAGWRLMDLDFW
jgi:hypothetical protein